MNKSRFISEFMPMGDKIYGLAFRFLKDSELAKDIVQSIYLKLWDKRNELKAVNNKQAFVLKMTKNACLDKIKQTKDNVDVMHYHNPSQPDYDNVESTQVIKAIIGSLPDQQKQIIEFRDIEGFSFDEIAEILEVSVNTIRASLSIARKKVREEFKKIYSHGLQ